MENIHHDDFSHKEAKIQPQEYVQRKQYLYVSVVKAKDLSVEDVTDGCERYVEVRVGSYKGTTRPLTLSEKNPHPEWDQVFVFLRDNINQDTMLEVIVLDTNDSKDDFRGWVLYDLHKVPERVEADNPILPEWYYLEDREGEKVKGELMLAMWWGIQADEAFSEAICAGPVDSLTSIRSKVYLSPKLWYLRVHVIGAQDLIHDDQTRSPDVYVKSVLGHQVLRTRVSMSKSTNPMWNEDLIFVAAEPSKEPLILSVEDKVAPDKDESLGRCVIPLQYVERRLDNRAIRSRWFDLQKDVIYEGKMTKQAKFASRIRMRICLEGGYHVLSESTHYISDFKPTAKQLWKNNIGILELGILSAYGLSPMKTKDGRATTDAYCVAKYGTKWVRTKTIINSLNPKWDEQYTWEVFDPCTILTIGVFDNFHLLGGDTRIGKVRIRVSSLEPGRNYTHSYPLLVLHASGVKKMGEISLAVRFTCFSLVKLMHMYTKTQLPEMHYICPLSVSQLDWLRHQATQMVSLRLSQAEVPLSKEVVDYMVDAGFDMWSMRRSKANFLRIKGVFDGLFAMWKNPLNIVAICIVFNILAMYPGLILSFIFLSLFVIGVWNYTHRPRYPPHMDARLSCADNAHPDELAEEFDTFPTSHPADISMRYDRLRSEYERIQRVVGDIATQGERLQSLISWRDPIATLMFVMFCLIAAIVMYAIPFYVVVIQTVIYVLNRQSKLPLAPINFFRRLPTGIDSML